MKRKASESAQVSPVKAQKTMHEKQTGHDDESRRLQQHEAKASAAEDAAQELLGLMVVCTEHFRSIGRQFNRDLFAENICDTRKKIEVQRHPSHGWASRRRLQDSKQSIRMRKLCSKAAEPGMFMNPGLKMLNTTWYSDVGDLKRRQDSVDVKIKELEEVETEMSTLLDNKEKLLTSRTAILLDHANVARSQDAEKCDGEIEALEKLFSKSWDRYSELQTSIEGTHQCEEYDTEGVLDLTDYFLVTAGLLKDTEDPPKEDGARQHGLERERDVDKRPSSQQDDYGQKNTDPHRTADHGLPRNDINAKANEAHPHGRSRRTASVPNLREQVRESMRYKLDKADRAWTRAEKAFHDVRQKYDLHFYDFLEARRHGEVKGTPTDFDLSYYLDRGIANRDLARAQSEYSHVKRQAQMAGALPAEQQSSLFADRSDDGYGDPGRPSPVHEEIQRMKWDVIERWLSNDEQGSGADERHGPVGRLHLKVDSVAAASSNSQDRYATGKRKRKIDEWAAHQEALRTTPSQSIPLPAERTESGSLFWFQEFCGI